MVENGCPVKENILEYILFPPEVTLDFLKGLKATNWAVRQAVNTKKLEIVTWVHKKCGELNRPDICSYAARIGSLEILKYLRDHGCPWNVFTCDEAAASGNLKLLKWARAEGCPWDTATFTRAASGVADPKIFEFLFREGCPWTDEVVMHLVDVSKWGLVRWAVERGCPYEEEILREAGKKGGPGMAEWVTRVLTEKRAQQRSENRWQTF
jgi:hypothetical protein